MTQHTRGRFHYPLPQVKDAQLLLRDATGTLLSTIPIDSAEWYGWLQDHTHQSFSYQTPTGQLRFVESNSVGGRIGMPIRASGEKFIKRMLGSQSIFLWNACKWSQPHYFSHQQYLLMWM